MLFNKGVTNKATSHIFLKLQICQNAVLSPLSYTSYKVTTNGFIRFDHFSLQLHVKACRHRTRFKHKDILGLYTGSAVPKPRLIRFVFITVLCFCVCEKHTLIILDGARSLASHAKLAQRSNSEQCVQSFNASESFLCWL